MTLINIVEDKEVKEHLTVDAMDSALNALEIVNEVYGLDNLEFVGEAVAKLKLALNTYTQEEWI